MRRPALFLALAALVLLSLPAASAQAASPWWQLLGGSRPTNLQVAPDQTEVQEMKPTLLEGSFAATVEVGGEALGCLGVGILGAACSPDSPVSSAAGFEEMLEAAYGEDVEVTGGPLGTDPFLITTPGRWVPPVKLSQRCCLGGFPIGSATVTPTSEGSGRLVLIATNLGDAPLDATSTPLTIEDRLPAGVQVYDAEAFAGYAGLAGPVDCAIEEVEEEEAEPISRLECSFEDELPSYEAIEIEIPVAVRAGAQSGQGEIAISGGEGPGHVAVPSASEAQTVTISDAPIPYGIEHFSARAEEEGGGEVTQAGTHPFQVTTTFQWNSGKVTPGVGRHNLVDQPALPRDTGVTFPIGLAGSARAVTPCPLADFLASKVVINSCPDSAAVGVASVTIVENLNFGLVRLAMPIFALPAARGEPARFGFMAVGVPVIIDTSIDPSDSYRITGEVRNAPQASQVLSATLSLWGVPGDPRHDSARGWGCTLAGRNEGLACEPTANLGQTPLLRMPVSCSAPLSYLGRTEAWNVPAGSLISALAGSPPPGACNQVPFDPSISNALTSRLAANPSGFDFELRLPNQWPTEAKEGAKSEAQPKKVEVTLPKGVTLNPSQAEGLATCSEAAYGRERYDSQPGEGCPEASKIGSVVAHSPAIEEPIEGALYVATPYENPTGAMIALYLVAKVPARGILVKLAGKVEPDPDTGQLRSTFDDIPQQPFSDFKLHFREGGRSPLITPPGCDGDPSEPGNQPFTTVARFTPWSAQDPDNPAPGEIVERTATMTIDHGVDGGACPTGPAPFDPGFEAGSLNAAAGHYSPFYTRLTRSDGEQDMGKLSFVLPPGVVPKLAGIPYCPEAGIAQAMARQGPHGGEEEKNDPSCPAASEIGRTVGGAGVGNQLTYVPGKLYLAGPYNGDPISAVAITPAVAGPFDAGTVVVREALRLNPVTHVGEVDGEASDPIPHILKGIPLNLRELQVYADRPEFTLTPTSCAPLEASARIWGDGTALEPRGETPVDLSTPYQAVNCSRLGFKPKLGLRLKGGTKRGKFPALRATYVPKKKNQANLRRMALLFPSSEFIEQGHFRTICTRVQFKAGNGFGEKCPKRSIYGHVKAWSPLLDEPLQGPVYLRSSNHNLPDAVFALHGLIDIEVSVRIDSVRGRLRATVQGVPDAPVSRAVVRMQGGQKGLFVNSRNLCHKQKRNHARANLSAQSNRRRLLKPLVRALGCGKKARRGRAGHRRR